MAMDDEEIATVLDAAYLEFINDPKVRQKADEALDEMYASREIIHIDETGMADQITTGTVPNDTDIIDLSLMTVFDWVDCVENPEDHQYEIVNMPENVREWLTKEGFIDG